MFKVEIKEILSKVISIKAENQNDTCFTYSGLAYRTTLS